MKANRHGALKLGLFSKRVFVLKFWAPDVVFFGGLFQKSYTFNPTFALCLFFTLEMSMALIISLSLSLSLSLSIYIYIYIYILWVVTF